MSDCQCVCHLNKFNPCDQPGGCGTNHRTTGSPDTPTPGYCHNLTRCPGWNGQHAEPTTNPLCRTCLDRAGQDISRLVYDYVDLAQLHETSLSQAPAEHTSGGGHESPTLIAEHVEALQAEIAHATALWEHALRAVGRLHNPRTFAPLWRTTVYDHTRLTDGKPILVKARPGHIVQRAVSLITGRLDRLAALPPITVCPTGIEDEPVRMHGWEAIHQLQDLHSRARSRLGRTRRITTMPGECSGCRGQLLRAEPRDRDDPCDVYCGTCRTSWSYDEYSLFVSQMLALPIREAAA